MLLGRICVLVDELSRVGDWLTVGSQRVLDEIEICVFERGSWRVEAYHADLHRDNVGEESLLDRCFLRDLTISRTSAMPLGSSPVVGSSSSTTSGSERSAAAILTLCFIPLENFPTFLSNHSSIFTSATASSIVLRLSPLGNPLSSATIDNASRGVRDG